MILATKIPAKLTNHSHFSMKEVQKEVNDWVTQYKIGYWKPLEIQARLTEEVGDAIFTLACLANSLGLDMERGFKYSMDKCYGRDKERFEKK